MDRIIYLFNIMNQSKLFILILLLLLFMVSSNKSMLIPITMIIMAFFIYKKQYNIALIVLSILFFISMIMNNDIETFQQQTTSTSLGNYDEEYAPNTTIPSQTTQKTQKTTQKTQSYLPSQPQQTTQQTTQSYLPSQPQQTTQALSNENIIHRINLADYNQLLFVFNSLLEPKYYKKNREYIENIIDDYKINSIFDLSRKVLNREKNPIYNNFLEKITCLENNSVNYILCDNENYKKIYAFCELLLVFTLDIDKIVELINKNEIYSVCKLSAKRAVLEDFDNQTSFGFESLGLQYYLNEKSFTGKYFDILKLLELDIFLNNDSNDEYISLRERLYNYHNSNKKVVKDLNSIMVLFDYYNIFDRYVLNIEDDEYNWNLGILKSVDLNKPCWQNVSFFLEYDVKNRIIKSINKLTSIDDEFLNRGASPSNPFDTSKQNNKSNPNVGKINMMQNSNSEIDVYEEEDDLFKENLNTFQTRYKTIYDKKVNENKRIEERLDKKLNLKYVKENFNGKMTDIVDDIAQLFQQKCNLDCYDTKYPMYSKFLFYIGEIFKILTKKERMFYVGILLVVISVILNFIVASK